MVVGHGSNSSGLIGVSVLVLAIAMAVPGPAQGGDSKRAVAAKGGPSGRWWGGGRSGPGHQIRQRASPKAPELPRAETPKTGRRFGPRSTMLGAAAVLLFPLAHAPNRADLAHWAQEALPKLVATAAIHAKGFGDLPGGPYQASGHTKAEEAQMAWLEDRHGISFLPLSACQGNMLLSTMAGGPWPACQAAVDPELSLNALRKVVQRDADGRIGVTPAIGGQHPGIQGGRMERTLVDAFVLRSHGIPFQVSLDGELFIPSDVRSQPIERLPAGDKRQLTELTRTALASRKKLSHKVGEPRLEELSGMGVYLYLSSGGTLAVDPRSDRQGVKRASLDGANGQAPELVQAMKRHIEQPQQLSWGGVEEDMMWAFAKALF